MTGYPPQEGPALVGRLSERERECVRATQAGLRNAEIAARLGIARSTVSTHLLRAYEKLGVEGRDCRTLAAVALYRYEAGAREGRGGA